MMLHLFLLPGVLSAEDRELILKTDRSKVFLEITEDGNILTGIVERPEDAELAIDTVLARQGITSVEDHIQVRGVPDTVSEDPDISISDYTRDLAVNLNLLLNPNISGATIRASVENGKVILEGTVETEAEKLLVEEKVRQRTGAAIVNRLEIGEGKSLNKKAETALFYIGKTGIFLFIFSFILMGYLYSKNYKETISSKKKS
jgi:osmotically-inducible protein OsmY